MLLLLLACTADQGVPPPSDTAPDTGPDTSPGTDTAVDTAPDSGSASPGLTWPGTLDAPDVRVEGCGSTEDMGEALAGDGNLDGDALPELAVGAPGHDEIAVDFGAVYVFLGSALAGDLDVTAAHVVIRSTWDTDEHGTAVEDRFGSRVQWLGDLDGDGLDELGVWRGPYRFSVFEGSTLFAGGEITDDAAAATHEEEDATVVPYPDLDGDGLDDVALGLPYRGMMDGTRDRGTVALASGLALLDDALPTLREVYGLDAEAHAGAGLDLVEDKDGDGFPDFATSLGGDIVLLGSAAVLASGTLYADDAVTARWEGTGQPEGVTAFGDADGGGLVDLAVWYGGALYALRGEDAGGSLADAPVVDCGWSCQAWSPARDLDGDGVEDLWLVASGGAYAVGGADFLAGTADPSVPLASVASPVTIHGIAVEDAADGVWVGLDAYWTTGGGAARFDMTAGDALTTDAAEVTVTSAWAGWQVRDPAFADLTGDGTPEIVFEDEDAAGIAVFDGTRVAAGGSLALCDADWVLVRDAEPVAWLDDADGDGAAEVLLRQGEGRDAAFSVRGGRALLGLEPDDLREVRATRRLASEWFLSSACDVTGDGRPDFVEFDGDDAADVIDGRAWVDGYDEATHLLGRIAGIDEYSGFGCLDDFDGDGAEELASEYYRVFLSSALDPASTLEPGVDDWAFLEPSYLATGVGFTSRPYLLGDVDGDGLPDHAFVTAPDSDVYDDVDKRVALVPGSALAAGGVIDADAYPPALTLAGEWSEELILRGSADVDGDGLEDAIVLWEDATGHFRLLGAPAADLLTGAAVAAEDALVVFDVRGGEASGIGAGDITLGPDYGGGGPTIVLESEEASTGHRTVTLVHAR